MNQSHRGVVGNGFFAGFIFSLLLFSCFSVSGGLQKINVGIYGGQLLDIASADISGTNVLLIGVDCNRGVFKWDEATAEWATVSWPEVAGKAVAVEFNRRVGYEAEVYAIITDISNQTHLVASPSSGTAGTWTNLQDELFTVLAGHSSGMYVGTRAGEIYRNQADILTVPPIIETLSTEVTAISPFSEDLFFAARTHTPGQTNIYRVDQVSPGVFASTPLVMPTTTASGSTDVKIYLIGVDPADSNRIFCAGDYNGNSQVYLSTDGGQTWSIKWDKVASGVDYFPGGRPCYIKFDNNRTFISHSCLLNGTTNWTYQQNARTEIVQVGGVTNVVETHPNDGALAVDATDNTIVYVATDWAIAAYSCDALGVWGDGSEVGTNNGITGVILNDVDFYSYSATNKMLWIAAKSGIGRTVSFDPAKPATTATPADWIFPLYPDGSPATAIAINQTYPGIVFAGYNSGRIFKTQTATNLVATNITWTQVFDASNFPTVFPSEPNFVTISEISIVPATPSNMYAAAYRWQPPMTNGGIFYSNDEGVNWSVDFSNEPVNALYVSDIVTWAGVGNEESLGRGMRVRSGPASWWNPGTGLAMDNQIVNDLDGAQTGSSVTVYFAADGGVYKGFLPSTSMGGWSNWIWSDLSASVGYWNTNFSAVTVNPDDPDEVFVAAGNAMLRSLDGGTTWNLLPGSGSITHEDIRVLKYDDLLAGTANGLYSYLDNDFTLNARWNTSGNELFIIWEAAVDTTNQVQILTDLTDGGVWSNEGAPIMGHGSMVTATVSVASPQKFMRVNKE